MIIYGVYRNQDMTEGRGPMVLDLLFLDKNKAIRYMNFKEGVFGRMPKQGWINEEFADWQIRELEVIE